MQQKTVNGIAFLVDPEDLELMKGRLWKAYNLGGKWYVQGLPDGQFLHRGLAGPDPTGGNVLGVRCLPQIVTSVVQRVTVAVIDLSARRVPHQQAATGA